MIDDLKHDDHEGAMARSELYRAAKYAMKLFQMIEENQDLEGWVQSKITKSADYLDSVYHYMEYHLKFGGGHGAESLDDITKDAEDEIEDSLADAQATADAEEEIKLDETLTYEQKLHAILEGRVSKISEKKKCKSKKMEEEAVSKAQQRAAGAALAAKRGDIPKSKLKGASKEMVKMSKGDLEDFAGTKHKGLPQKVKEGAKPDYLDLDKDGNKKEPMKKAAKDAKKKKIKEGILDTIGDKIKGYRDASKAKHQEREAALKLLGNYIKDNSEDEAIVGRLYAVCLGDELECFYSYIVEKGLPITSEIKAIASKFKLKGTANMQVDENNLVKKVVKRVVAEKKAKPDFLDVDKDGNKKEPMKKALKDKEKETVKESAELTRMKQFLTRLNG